MCLGAVNKISKINQMIVYTLSRFFFANDNNYNKSNSAIFVRGDLNGIPAKIYLLPGPVKFFSSFFLVEGYFDPVNIFLMVKITNFRGDLSDVSAKTAALAWTSLFT